MQPDIAMDLGSSNIRVYVQNQGVLIQEPSIVAFNREMKEIHAIGIDANTAFQHSMGNLIEFHPIRRGIIVDFTVTEKIIKHFLLKASGKMGFQKQRICFGISGHVTDVQERTLISAAIGAGVRDVSLLSGCKASAIAAGIDIDQAMGNLVVNMGGGHTDIELISIGETVNKHTVMIGGTDFDDVIIRFLKKEHQLLIGSATAEDIKIHMALGEIEILGRDLHTGVSKSIKIQTQEIVSTYYEYMDLITQGIHTVLSTAPPELCADIYDRGIVLSGGGSLLRGLEEYLSLKTGLQTVLVHDPLLAVVNGCGKVNIWK